MSPVLTILEKQVYDLYLDKIYLLSMIGSTGVLKFGKWWRLVAQTLSATYDGGIRMTAKKREMVENQ